MSGLHCRQVVTIGKGGRNRALDDDRGRKSSSDLNMGSWVTNLMNDRGPEVPHMKESIGIP